MREEGATTAANISGDHATQIRDYVARNLLFSDSGFNYADDTSFMDEGIIDSLGIMELVTFVETNFDISVADDEVVPDNFDSVKKLDAFIRCKLGAMA